MNIGDKNNSAPGAKTATPPPKNSKKPAEKQPQMPASSETAPSAKQSNIKTLQDAPRPLNKLKNQSIAAITVDKKPASESLSNAPAKPTSASK